MGANGTSNPLDFDELTEIIRRAVLKAALLARLTHPTLQGDLEVADGAARNSSHIWSHKDTL